MHEFTTAEKHYIRTTHKKKTPKEIAQDLGVHTNTIKAFIEKDPEVKKSLFDTQSGSVSMTQESSESSVTEGDKVDPKIFFDKRYQNCVHKLDPNKPIV